MWAWQRAAFQGKVQGRCLRAGVSCLHVSSMRVRMEGWGSGDAGAGLLAGSTGGLPRIGRSIAFL